MRKIYVVSILGVVLFGLSSLIFLDYRCRSGGDDEGGCLWKRGIPFTFERGIGDAPPERNYGFLFLNFIFWVVTLDIVFWVYQRFKK